MKRAASALGSALFLACVSVACAQNATSIIPQVHAATLAGAPVDLPGNLNGSAAVLIFGFSQASRAEVAAWGKRLAQDYNNSHTVSYYELAQLQSVPRPLRGWVGRRIAGSIPDRAKPHFVILTDHEAEWKVLTGFKQPDSAYLLLIDRTGTVQYRAVGVPTDAAYTALKQHLESIAPQPAPAPTSRP